MKSHHNNRSQGKNDDMIMTIQLSEIINNTELENKNYYYFYYSNNNISNNNNQTNYLTPKMFQEFLFWLVRLEVFHHNEDKRKYPPPMSSDHFVMLFRLMYGYSLRVSDALNLTRQDIDRSHKIIKIREVSEIQHQRMQVSSGIKGIIDSDNIVIENSLNEDVSIIQIRVYDDDNGDFVQSFPINQTISGNVSFEFDDLPQELRGMIGGDAQ